MIRLSAKGDYKKANSFLEKMLEVVNLGMLDKYGRKGVDALAAATPKDSGETANSWYYEIDRDGDKIFINWLNDNVNDGVNIAVILQYGHGTGTGGYVEGVDYINPAMVGIFDQIADDAWKEVQNS